jgi:hypothetical protein
VSTQQSDGIDFGHRLVDDLATSVRWFTQGAVHAEWDGEQYVVAGTEEAGHILSIGPRKACAYLVGGALGYARHSGDEIPGPIMVFLRAVQTAYREGLTHRFADEENQGAEHARLGWLRITDA